MNHADERICANTDYERKQGEERERVHVLRTRVPVGRSGRRAGVLVQPVTKGKPYGFPRVIPAGQLVRS